MYLPFCLGRPKGERDESLTTRGFDKYSIVSSLMFLIAAILFIPLEYCKSSEGME